MRRVMGVLGMVVVGLLVGLVARAAAACPSDSVHSGAVCMDKYEASVWYVPPKQKSLISKIQKGTVTLANLTSPAAVAAGVAHLGLGAGDLAAAGCPDTGNGCVNFYAVSIPGVTPSAFLNWFQAAAVARNSLKRLPTNQEWQVAALGTPDGAPCIVSAAGPGPTGTAGCVSDVGAFDMVGNLYEWVADWVPLSTACTPSLFGTGDSNCLAGASTTSGPGALIRGGNYTNGGDDGVFNVVGLDPPTSTSASIGFRAAR